MFVTNFFWLLLVYEGLEFTCLKLELLWYLFSIKYLLAQRRGVAAAT